MAKRILYNVGTVDVGGTQKNIFLGNADGVSFIATRDGDENAPRFKYLTRDWLMTQLGLNKAVVDNRLDIASLDNANAPNYTNLVGGFGRTVTIENYSSTLVANYNGDPYYALRGDGVQEVTSTSSLTGTTDVTAATAATTGSSSTNFMDQIMTFVTNNLALIIIAVVALVWFDPFGWNLLGKKKKRR